MPRRMGEVPLPKERPLRRMAYSGFRGIDRRGGVRQDFLAVGEGLDPRALPALQALRAPRLLAGGLVGETLALGVIGSSLFRVYKEGGSIFLSRRRASGATQTVTLSSQAMLDAPRALVPFHLYSNPADPIAGSFRHMVLVLPDRVMLEAEADELRVESLRDTATAGGVPEIHYACVHLSRVFGAREDRLFASAFNNPRNWNLDTATDIDASHAWASAVQSNTRAGGSFTALTVYRGHVLAFKEDFCHELNNNKNPFRVSDLLTVGTTDSRSLAEVNGKLFFVGRDGVYRYAGGDSATRISDVLDVQDYSGARAAAYGGMYLLYLPALGRLLLYAEETEAWTMLAPFENAPIVAMAAGGDCCYLVDEAGNLYQFDAGEYGRLSAETTPVLNEALGRLTRLSLAVTGEAGATLSVTYLDSTGRKTPLAAISHAGGTRRFVSRAFTPADYGGRLCLQGTGRLMLHDLSLEVAED